MKKKRKLRMMNEDELVKAFGKDNPMVSRAEISFYCGEPMLHLGIESFRMGCDAGDFVCVPYDPPRIRWLTPRRVSIREVKTRKRKPIDWGWALGTVVGFLAMGVFFYFLVWLAKQAAINYPK